MIERDRVRIEPIPGTPRAFGHVSRAESRWMLEAIAAMERVVHGWSVVHEEREKGRRWPWWVQLGHPTAPIFVDVHPDSVTFGIPRGCRLPGDEVWPLFWRAVKLFAKRPAVIFHPDNDDILSASLSISAARERYNLM